MSDHVGSYASASGVAAPNNGSVLPPAPPVRKICRRPSTLRVKANRRPLGDQSGSAARASGKRGSLLASAFGSPSVVPSVVIVTRVPA